MLLVIMLLNVEIIDLQLVSKLLSSVLHSTHFSTIRHSGSDYSSMLTTKNIARDRDWLAVLSCVVLYCRGCW